MKPTESQTLTHGRSAAKWVIGAEHDLRCACQFCNALHQAMGFAELSRIVIEAADVVQP